MVAHDTGLVHRNMKKLVLVMLSVFVFSAYGVSQEIKMMRKGVIDPGPFGGGMTVYEVRIDSCEYLLTRMIQSGNVLTHKGNCKHCAKIRQREHRELIEAIRSIQGVEAKRK